MAHTDAVVNSWEEGARSSRFQRDAELENVLRTLNDRLRSGDRQAHPPSGLPQVFILGCARSGSTLLLQWLAASGRFCYPTNILSRFYGDPYVGALVHRALFELDENGEIFPERPEQVSAFRSMLGRAKGAAEPHDFGYFWRSYFRFGATQADLLERPSTEMLHQLRSDLEGVRAVFRKPMVMKAMQMNWQLDLLVPLFPDALFLFNQRDEVDNARSLLEARRAFANDEGKWFSFKPAEHARIAELPPFDQTLAQVRCTNRAIERQLQRLPQARVLRVDYQDLCERPAELFARIAGALGMDAAYDGPSSFPFKSGGTAEERARAAEVLKAWPR